MACSALMKDMDFDGKTRFYFALCAAVTASSKINKPIADIAQSALVDYRVAQRYLKLFVESGKVIRTGVPRHYEYELNEIYSWHGSEESRNNRMAKRQKAQLTKTQKRAAKANMKLLDGGKKSA